MFGAGSAAPPDPQVVSPPRDTVQAMAWSPKANVLASGSWDGVVRCWEISPQGVSNPKAEQTYPGPVLDVSWHDDGTKLFSTACDGVGRVWDLASNQSLQVAKHDAPIKTCHWVQSLQMLMTGSWDKTVRFWDCRQQTPTAQLQMPERVYAADVLGDIALIATADRQMVGLSLSQQTGPRQVYLRQTHKLKMATRCVGLLPTRDGFAVGTVEGRVGIQYFDESRSADNFTFKCHNDQDNFYCVNSITFHPRHGTFATGGSDGKIFFWDKNSRMRLKTFNPAPAPVTCARFNADGSLLAYSFGYDWHKGHSGASSAVQGGICIHPTTDAEIGPRPSTAAGALRPGARR